MYKLLCMAFDGESQLERREFKTISDAWDYDIGSRWYFYPFHFIVTASGKTIADTPYQLDFLRGKRVKTVERLFAELLKILEKRRVTLTDFMEYMRDYFYNDLQLNFDYVYSIDLNERGLFRASVSDCCENEIYTFDNEESEDGSISLIDDGYMKNIDDVEGLKNYLISIDVLPQNAQLVKG